MNIRYLKQNHPEIYKRIEEENKLQNMKNIIGHGISKELAGSFRWRPTEEGWNIWDDIDNGNFDSFYNFHKKINPQIKP